MEHGLRGIRAFHDGRRLAAFLALTIVIWNLDAFMAMTIGKALRGLAIPIPVAFLLIAGLARECAAIDARLCRHLPVRRRECSDSLLVSAGPTRSADILVFQALQYVVIGSLRELWAFFITARRMAVQVGCHDHRRSSRKVGVVAADRRPTLIVVAAGRALHRTGRAVGASPPVV